MMKASGSIKNIGFISTRLQGTDGVSLETAKWVTVLEKLGYNCFFLAGLSDWEPKKTMILEEAYFDHPEIREIQKSCFGRTKRASELTGKIHNLRMRMKEGIYEFLDRFSIDLIIPENAITIPMNVAFGTAITEIIAETGIPTIAHHHDFSWERQRFLVNCIPDFLTMAFPPVLPSIQHIVINSPADKELSFRTGISAIIIPNILDFDTPPPGIDNYNKDVRKDLGLKDDDVFILQPTRIVARKGIEHSIELVSRLKNPKAKLVITHSAGDEGMAYQERIINYAKIMKVPLIIRPEIIGENREKTADGRKIYTLWDIYPHSDIVTYPSVYEGFGNAFLEAIYFKKPTIVNRYSIYEVDIEPKGFDVITMDGYITDRVIDRLRTLLKDPKEARKMTELNYHIAQRFFSYGVLENKLQMILMNFQGLVK